VNHASSNPFDSILGQSPAIRQVKELIRQIAPTDINVLIVGESGTGKELVARSIHQFSRRSTKELVVVNCGAIPEGVFESEVFGHEKGSFTSADQRRKGYFELADGGSLFLDEIGETPLQAQVKLLRVLENGSFLRVGGTSEIAVNVRVIAATNKDLENEVLNNRFRSDLFFRLKTITIVLPSLRDRREDIPLLVNQFAVDFSERNKRNRIRFDSLAMSLLREHAWSGNIRELKNSVESLIALSRSDTITAQLVEQMFTERYQPARLPILANRPTLDTLDPELIYHSLLDLRLQLGELKKMVSSLADSQQREVGYKYHEVVDAESYSLEDMNKEQIRRALDDAGGNRKRAAEMLGISERTLYRKIKGYQL